MRIAHEIHRELGRHPQCEVHAAGGQWALGKRRRLLPARLLAFRRGLHTGVFRERAELLCEHQARDTLADACCGQKALEGAVVGPRIGQPPKARPKLVAQCVCYSRRREELRALPVGRRHPWDIAEQFADFCLVLVLEQFCELTCRREQVVHKLLQFVACRLADLCELDKLFGDGVWH
eukprot:2850029-Prymnesium_polylepis.2